MDITYLKELYITHLKEIQKYSALFSVLTFYLGAKQRQAIWPVSMGISAVNLLIYYHERLFGSCLQNIIYVLVSLHGWYTWRYGGQHKRELTTITRTSAQQALLLLLGVGLYTAVLNIILVYMQASFTLLDAVRSALTMVGLWLTSYKKLETYLLWMVVNAVSILLFYQKDMGWFALKYAVLLGGSVYSYWMWWQQYQAQQQAAGSTRA